MCMHNRVSAHVTEVCVQYGSNFDTATAVGELTALLNNIHKMYGRPLWLTEFGLTAYTVSADGASTSAPIYPSWDQQVAFVNAIVPELENLSYVERFAWFALPADEPYDGDSKGLYQSFGSPTPTGAAYRTF